MKLPAAIAVSVPVPSTTATAVLLEDQDPVDGGGKEVPTHIVDVPAIAAGFGFTVTCCMA